MTKMYAVIGDPIDHSLSPTIHNAAFRKLDMDCTYIAYKISKEELEEGILSLKKIDIKGFNVTIPHKINIMKYLDKLDQNSSIIGACNTVVNCDGVLKGFNTDMEGFIDPIKKKKIEIKESNVLLLGAGGAARAIIAGFAKEKAKKITIINKTWEKAKELAQFSKKIGLDSQVIKFEEVSTIPLNDFKFIVNATSIGLKDEATPINTGTLNERSIVYDIVYKPIQTDLIKKSKSMGATIIYGYEMLLGQAVRSFEIWHKINAPYDVMKQSILGGGGSYV